MLEIANRKIVRLPGISTQAIQPKEYI